MNRAQRGLTMIEVLAAMVVFSTGAVVLFGWIGQTADRLGKLQNEQIALFNELSALAYMRSLNPMRDPQGEVRLNDARLRWTALPVGSEQPSRGPTGLEGIYVVQLYKVDLRVDIDRKPPVERSLWLAGWRQVRAAGTVNPFGTTGSDSPVPATPGPSVPPSPSPRP